MTTGWSRKKEIVVVSSFKLKKRMMMVARTCDQEFRNTIAKFKVLS